MFHKRTLPGQPPHTLVWQWQLGTWRSYQVLLLYHLCPMWCRRAGMTLTVTLTVTVIVIVIVMALWLLAQARGDNRVVSSRAEVLPTWSTTVVSN